MDKPTLISEEKVKRLCESNTHIRPFDKEPSAEIVLHTKSVFSDGWTRWECSWCGQVSFTYPNGISFFNNSLAQQKTLYKIPYVEQNVYMQTHTERHAEREA